MTFQAICVDAEQCNGALVAGREYTLSQVSEGRVSIPGIGGSWLGRRFQPVSTAQAPTPAEPPPEAAVAPAEGLPGGVKHDAGKARLDLLPAEALVEIAGVLGAGAEKYAPHNWRKGFAYSRLVAAALRHIFAWVGGEDKDPETGRSHLAHAACCLMFLITFEHTRTGTDDRYSN